MANVSTLLTSWLEEANDLANKRSDKNISFADFVKTMKNQSYFQAILRLFALDYKDFNRSKFIEKMDDFIIHYESNYVPEPASYATQCDVVLQQFIDDTKAKVSQDNNMDIKHVFIALTSLFSPLPVFRDFNITEDFIYEVHKDALKEALVEGNTHDFNTKIIDEYTTDLTLEASRGLLTPVVCRDIEMSSLIYALLMRDNNYPLIYGEPGVGRESIVKNLAQKIVNNNVPLSLQECRVVKLNLTSFTTASKNNNVSELKTFKQLLNELEMTRHKVILFIDDVQMLIGTTYGSLMKPYLDNNKILFIGSTTTESYKVKISKDDNYQHVFQAIEIEEPTTESALEMLKALKPVYSSYHNVEISDMAIESAVKMSDRYINGSYLPSKAIILLDEASARLRNQLDSQPIELEEKRAELDSLMSDEIALKNTLSKTDLEKLNDKINISENEFNSLMVKWNKETSIRELIKNCKENLVILLEKEKRALNNKEIKLASQLSHQDIPELREKLHNLLEEYSNMDVFVSHIVDENHIAQVVESKTGIPVGKLVQGEITKLIEMENVLNQKVIGQEHVIKKLTEAVKASRVGLSDPNKPLASLLSLGTSGVGKTFVAKELAKFLFDDENAMIRLDMSEYMEQHSVSRLIGAPPGYAGYDEGGQLTDAVKKRPYSVILFDEIEKAHEKVFDILLQVLDDGRLTDSKGITIDFKNTIIILTSNLGAKKYLLDKSLTQEEAKQGVMNTIKEKFRPEFLNRIDNIEIFNNFTVESIKKLVHIELAKINKRLEPKGLQLELTTDATNWLVENGYDPENGARPLKRLIESSLVKQITNKILLGEITNDNIIKVDFNQDTNTLEIN